MRKTQILEQNYCLKSVQIRIFFRTALSHIWTEYGDLKSKSPYSVQIRENTDKKKTTYLCTFCAVKLLFQTSIFKYLSRSRYNCTSRWWNYETKILLLNIVFCLNFSDSWLAIWRYFCGICKQKEDVKMSQNRPYLRISYPLVLLY